MNMRETWKEHPTYSKYLISTLGRVATIKTNRIRRYSKIGGKGIGYAIVSISHEGEHLGKMVHVLVAETFIGPKVKGMVVNHKDGNKLNNCLENLEYLTYSENSKHAYASGLRSPVRNRGELAGGARLTNKQVSAIKKAMEGYSPRGESRGLLKKLAVKYGVGKSTITMIRLGQQWKEIPR